MKKTLSFVCAILLSVSLFAGIRSQEAAAELAATTLTQSSPALRAPIRAQALKLAYIAPKQGAAEPAFYAFNHADGGFAVISADDRTEEVLCYSTTGRLDTATMNPSLKWWLSRFAAEISSMSDDETYEAPERVTAEPIEPLLGDITWAQGTPYNNMCPIDMADNTRCYTGCVATAAAQIMRYWQAPAKGIGTKTYTWINYDPDSYGYWGYSDILQTLDLTADYENTFYDWENMLPGYESVDYTIQQGQAVATLMFHCGVACEMEYGGDAMGGSGAMIDDMGNGMVEHFGYTYSSYLDQYSSYVTTSQIQTAFNGDLEAGRPILMGGYDDYAGGHAFVCDGRDFNGKFHINWGWEGDGNCFTTLSAMKPDDANYHFKNYLTAVIGLEPAKHPTTPADGHYATCQEANTASAGDTLFMSPVTVVYANEQYNYLSDATGGALLFNSSYGLKTGDEVTGLVALSSPEKQLPRMRGVSYKSELTITEGTVPEPALLKKAPTDAQLNHYVRFENLAMEGRFTTASRSRLTATMPDGTKLVIYNQFKVPFTFLSTARYNLNGFVSRFNDEIRIFPIAFEERENTGIEETTAGQTPQTVKRIENGRIVIVRDGVRYSVLGDKID